MFILTAYGVHVTVLSRATAFRTNYAINTSRQPLPRDGRFASLSDGVSEVAIADRYSLIALLNSAFLRLLRLLFFGG